MNIKGVALHKVCPTGNCPAGIDSVRAIGLTPQEKRSIFFSLKGEIFKQKRLLAELF